MQKVERETAVSCDVQHTCDVDCDLRQGGHMMRCTQIVGTVRRSEVLAERSLPACMCVACPRKRVQRLPSCARSSTATATCRSPSRQS